MICLIVTFIFAIPLFYLVLDQSYLTGDVVSSEISLDVKTCVESNFDSNSNYKCVGKEAIESYSGCSRADEGNAFEKGSLCVLRKSDGKQICIGEDFCGVGEGSLNQLKCVSDSEYVFEWVGCLNGCFEGKCLEE